MARRKKDAPEDGLAVALREGWSAACRLYEHLYRGGEMPAMPPGPVRLEPGETGYAEGVLGYKRFYGKSVTYRQSSSLLIGSASFVLAGMAAESISNASARNRAAAEAAAQWRDHANVRTLLTDRRLWCDYGGRWLSFWHNGVVEFNGDLDNWLFVLRYKVGDPLMMHGPAAPWFAVGIAYIVYGRDGLRLPVLGPVARSVYRTVEERRQRVITGEIAGEIAGEIVEPDRKALPPAP